MLTGTAAILGLVAAILTSLGIIHVKLIKPLYLGAKKVGHVFDKVLEFDDRLTKIEKNSRQLTNNGGTHLKDAVDRIERTLSSHITSVALRDSEVTKEFLGIYKHLSAQDVTAKAADAASIVRDN